MKHLYILMVLLLLGSCIEPVDIKTTEEKKLLVFQGFISTEPGPHVFKLSKSAKYGSIFEGFSQKEENATIFIKDSDGEQTFLIETFPGTYQTPVGFQAQVGKSYTLVINSTGGQYISSEERVIQAPQLKEVSAEFSSLSTSDTLDFSSGVQFYAHFDDPAEEQTFMLFQNASTYEIHTRPELYRIPGMGGGTPAPKDCCALCYRKEVNTSTNVNLYSDSRTDGNDVRTEAYFVGDDGLRFVSKYHMILKQHSLTREAFQFYKLLKEQLEISGDIFDPPPGSVRGNIINVDNPDVDVIGYFHATDVSVDSVFVDQSLITKKQKPVQINDDCREIGVSSEFKPDFWQ